jgi:hypothetical protein
MSEETFLESIPDEFWRTVEEARQDPERLRVLLKRMSRDELVRFAWTYEALANELRAEQYWTPELSDDGLFELAHWVLAQGKDYYERVWENAEEMPREKKRSPGLLHAIEAEYEERFGEDIPLNTNEWDEEWKSHGKKTPWG